MHTSLFEAEERGDKVTDETIYSLDEITAMSSEDQINQKLVQGPELPAEQKDELIRAQHQNDLKQVLNHYWQFVRENPQDFNGWCYLIQHVENIDDMDEVLLLHFLSWTDCKTKSCLAKL